jgi:hypothetical protein
MVTLVFRTGLHCGLDAPDDPWDVTLVFQTGLHCGTHLSFAVRYWVPSHPGFQAGAPLRLAVRRDPGGLA